MTLATTDQLRIQELEEDNQRLRDELELAKSADARAAISVASLQRMLRPLYTALGQIFGEVEALGLETDLSVERSSSKVQAVWDDWKTKLPPSCGKVIDALLMHGPMTQQQICVAARMSPNTLGGGLGVLARLSKGGLIDRRDGKIALKKI